MWLKLKGLLQIFLSTLWENSSFKNAKCNRDLCFIIYQQIIQLNAMSDMERESSKNSHSNDKIKNDDVKSQSDNEFPVGDFKNPENDDVCSFNFFLFGNFILISGDF